MTDLKTQLEGYLQEMEETKGITKRSADPKDLSPGRAPFQMSYNGGSAVLTMFEEISLGHIQNFRNSALGLLLTWPYPITAEERQRDLKAMREDQQLFEKYFPRSEFPSLYEENNTLEEEIENEVYPQE